MGYVDMNKEQLFEAKARLERTREEVSAIFSAYPHAGFNESFTDPSRLYSNLPYKQSSEKEEAVFSQFSGQVLTLVSDVVEFNCEDPAYNNLFDYAQAEWKTHQGMVWLAVDALADDMKFVNFLIVRMKKRKVLYDI